MVRILRPQLESAGSWEIFFAFEIQPGNTYAGTLPNLNPGLFMGGTATKQANSGQYNSAGPVSFGLRIDAVSPVPEPASVLLMGMGFLGMGRLRRKN